MTIKKCNRCKQDKNITEFFRDSNNLTDGRYSICKVCKNEGTAKWRDKNREYYNSTVRAWGAKNKSKRYTHEIKRRYGCTQEVYDALLKAQSNKCALCLKKHNPEVEKGRLFVDHCHSTKQIRGLLCSWCNSALGYFKDDTRIMAEAIAYIVRHRDKKVS